MYKNISNFHLKGKRTSREKLQFGGERKQRTLDKNREFR